jgi:UDPglucose 6-dehydrogenase
MKKLKMSIIGYGFVGKAVDFGFDNECCEKTLIDINFNNSVKDTSKFDDVFFICLPTPMNADKSIDASIVVEAVEYLKLNRTGTIIIKSTVTPEIIEELTLGEYGSKVVYNPEFLTEANANQDFVNPPMHIFGGNILKTKEVEDIYRNYSLCNICPIHHIGAKEASFVKYGVNTFLATKVLWFNQFYDVVQNHGCNYNEIVLALSNDMRIGPSHTHVPGFDGKRGYGGACFPKDTTAFSNFAKSFSVLDTVIEANNMYRSGYEKDEREMEQNVNYD